MRRPSIDLAVAINRFVRADDEWFDEPDDIDRLRHALAAAENFDDPVRSAGVLAFRVARAQAFGEGNKRTALLLAKWTLDRNGIDGASVIRPDDFVLADLLVKAASGINVEDEVVDLLTRRLEGLPESGQ